VYVGDHPNADIAGAKAAGMRTIWKRDRYWGECQTADAVIEELPELPPILVSWA
jgi:putative hydrolase of the HAD superfamily